MKKLIRIIPIVVALAAVPLLANAQSQRMTVRQLATEAGSQPAVQHGGSGFRGGYAGGHGYAGFRGYAGGQGYAGGYGYAGFRGYGGYQGYAGYGGYRGGYRGCPHN